MAKELMQTRASIKGSLTKMKNFAAQFNIVTDDISNIKVRDDNLTVSYANYNAVQLQLEELDFEKYNPDRGLVEDIYFDIKASFLSILSKHALKTSPPSTSKENGSTVSESVCSVKLPQLQIPKFSGDYKEWQNFIDIFTSIIHDSSNLAPIQKLYYLKSSLSGEALKTIQSIISSSENYEVALKLLKDRYENKQFIANCHLKEIIELPVVSRDVSSLRHLIYTTKQNLQSLTNLQLPVNK